MTRQFRHPIRSVFVRLVPVAAACGFLAASAPHLAAAQQSLVDGGLQEAGEPTIEIREAADVTLDDFLWTNRLVVVFADSEADPRFSEQIEMIRNRPAGLIERDVIVLTDTDPDARSPLRTKLRPRGFQVTLIGKDGEVELRKPSPWSSRELSRSIDKMPLRKQEIREQKADAG